MAIEEDAIPEDMTMEDLADEVSRPDMLLKLRSGAIGGNKVMFNIDRELGQWHLELMSRNINMIQQVGGVTDELLGRSTNAQSGVAVQKRQEQGSLATSKFFDNLRFAVQQHGEITLCNVEQFVTEEKQFRITNQRGNPEYLTMNDGLPENDITRSKADFVISESEWRATMRQASLDQLTEMLSKMPPQVALAMLDLVVELMDIENRGEIAKRIRDINGMRDPDATEPTPEELQKMQAMQAQQQAQQAMFEAELAEKQAKAKKTAAEADRVKGQMVVDGTQAAQQAMEAASTVVTMPTTAKVADKLLQWAGGDPAAVPAPAMQGMPPGAAQQPPAAPMPPAGQPQPPQGA